MASDKTSSSHQECGRGDDTDLLESVEFENVLAAIGTSSVRYQLIQTSIVFCFIMPYALASYSFLFIGYEPPHVCAVTNETNLLVKHSLENDTTARVLYETCQIRITSNASGNPKDVATTSCTDGHSYEGGKDVSLKTEWDLVCGNEGVAELVQTGFSIGMTVGSPTISQLSDRFGRKYIILMLILVGNTLEIGMAFSPSISVAIVLKFFSGCVLQNLCVIPYVLGLEILVTDHRQICAFMLVVVWASYLILEGIIAYALRFYSWRHLQFVSSISGAIPLLFVYFLNESVSWLFAKGKHNRALKIIKQACKINGIKHNEAEHAYHGCVARFERIQTDNKDSEIKTSASKYGILDIFRHRRLLNIALALFLTWFTHEVTYSGLYLTSATFNVNRFFMFIILAALEIPASLFFYFLVLHMGRRTIIIIFLPITATCLLVSACIAGIGSSESVHVSNASTAFFILGKFALDVSYSCIYTFTAEYFPTTLRSVGTGLCYFVYGLGAMLSPYLYPLFQRANWAPGVVLAALCYVTVAIYYPIVPETKGMELPTTIEEVEALPKIKLRKRNENNDTKVCL